jgi:hypothetical protein
MRKCIPFQTEKRGKNMALQVIKDTDAYDSKGKLRFCPNFSALMYDTPDEAAVKEVLRKTYGEGKLEKTGERRYTYITDSKTYFVSQF